MKEKTVEGYSGDSSEVLDNGMLTNTLVVPTPSPTAVAPTVRPSVSKPVPPTGVQSFHGESCN